MLGRICAAREEVGCTEVFVYHGFIPLVSLEFRCEEGERWGDGHCLLSSEVISKPSELPKPSKTP